MCPSSRNVRQHVNWEVTHVSVSLIAPQLIATPRSAIARHALVPSLCVTQSFNRKTPRLSSIVQSQGCAVHRVVSHVAVSPNVST
ncbi:hypothetical protein N665_0814s0001 [Sinapis alba]|nr:hypothetical protein N665_0814s0001 [Sinapis alba]